MIKQVVQGVGPALIQLHSNESPERVGEVQELSGLPVIKAVRIGTQADAADAERYAGVAQLVLFDAKPGAQANSLPGGNGAKFDWRLIAAWKGRSDFMLSGGLNPDNVGVAIAETHAAAVDVSSGVESAPGIKSPQLIRRFIAAARSENSSADQQG